MDDSLVGHSALKGILVASKFWEIINKAAGNVCVQVFVWAPSGTRGTRLPHLLVRLSVICTCAEASGKAFGPFFNSIACFLIVEFYIIVLHHMCLSQIFSPRCGLFSCSLDVVFLRQFIHFSEVGLPSFRDRAGSKKSSPNPARFSVPRSSRRRIVLHFTCRSLSVESSLL